MKAHKKIKRKLETRIKSFEEGYAKMSFRKQKAVKKPGSLSPRK